MIAWKKQGSGLVGSLTLTDGAECRAVLVGPRSDPQGAVLVVAGDTPGALEKMPLSKALGRLSPDTAIDIICAQERAFGGCGLEPI